MLSEETKVKRMFKKAVHEEYPSGLLLALSDRYHAAIPDFLLLIPKGQAIFFEAKAMSKKLRPAQKVLADLIVRQGIEYQVVSRDEDWNLTITPHEANP